MCVGGGCMVNEIKLYLCCRCSLTDRKPRWIKEHLQQRYNLISLTIQPPHTHTHTLLLPLSFEDRSTKFNNNQTTQPTLNYSLNMSSLFNNQYCLARGLTITCPTVVCPLRNHRGDGPYQTPEEVHGSSMVVSPRLTFALDCQNCSGNCHRGGV